MSRWHTDCENPDIFVDETLPKCRNCGKSPSNTDITPPEHAPDPPWTIPPDEEAGQFNLYWPPCVPYKTDIWTDDSELDLGLDWLYSDVAPCSQHPEDTEPSATDLEASEEPPSVVYPQRLGLDEFRLICLEPPKHPEDPVHLSLETYPRDHYPEYEAISYSWGGEDGECSLSEPVYIGEHWDIVFQTRNCRSMLLYLRPRRGVRMVWVDAICINQTDLQEREDQVVAMQDTYRRSLRVVVYLGESVVSMADDNPYPLRTEASSLAGSEYLLNDLLHCRYFSRVWVIQELILAPNIVIPFSGTEYHVTRGSMARLQDNISHHSGSDWEWEKTKVPWFQHVAVGGPLKTCDLREALRLSWGSRATDPRDKVFGVLGLLSKSAFSPQPQKVGGGRLTQGQGDYNEAWSRPWPLSPDYSITLSHTLIGVFSHLLINLGHHQVLSNALGPLATSPYPSWIPEWRNMSFLPDPTSPEYRWSPYIVSWEKNYIDWPPTVRIWVGYSRFSVRQSTMTWIHDASINRSSGGLNIGLFHLLEFASATCFRAKHERYEEGKIGSYTNDHLNIYAFGTGLWRLIILTEATQWDPKAYQGHLHLFIPSTANTRIGLVMVLQKTNLDGKFKLIACFRFISLHLIKKDEWERGFDAENNYVLLRQTGTRCEGEDEHEHVQLHDSLKDVARHARTIFYGRELWKDWQPFSCIFPGGWFHNHDIVTVLQKAIDKNGNSDIGFLESYLAKLNQIAEKAYSYSIEGEFIVFNFSKYGWNRFFTSYGPGGDESAEARVLCGPQPRLPAEINEEIPQSFDSATKWYILCGWGFALEDWGKRFYVDIQWEWDRGSTAGSLGNRVLLRAKIENIRLAMASSRLGRALRHLRYATKFLPETETDFILREERPGDCHIPCQNWPEGAAEDLGLDGRVQWVEIV